MRRGGLGLALALATLLGGQPGAAAGDAVEGGVVVFAASSLTEAFTELAARFERQHPDADVTLSFGSSSTLATQIEQGGPADVFASADEASMDRLVDGGLVDEAHDVFARNRLTIAVAPGNPKRVRELADTLDDDVTLVLCAPEAPCGRLAEAAYVRAGLTLPNVPRGQNAKDTLAKVVLGEADAAVVYVTDARAAADDVDTVRIPAGKNVVARYPIAPVVDAGNGPAAKAFVRLVQSRAGQRILRRFGFLEP